MREAFFDKIVDSGERDEVPFGSCAGPGWKRFGEDDSVDGEVEVSEGGDDGGERVWMGDNHAGVGDFDLVFEFLGCVGGVGSTGMKKTGLGRKKSLP